MAVDSCGRRGIGETPECDSTRRLTSRPRKATASSGNLVAVTSQFISGKVGYFAVHINYGKESNNIVNIVWDTISSTTV
jgi:hypothetical protein